MYIEIRKIYNPESVLLNTVTHWMYNWWGKDEGYEYETIKSYMYNSMQKERLPQIFGLFSDNKIIGMYQITYNDLFVRPDIYPWLANVYIVPEFRGLGYGRELLMSIEDNARDNLDYESIYLFTRHKGLCEKFGWQFISEVETHLKDLSKARLYSLGIT